MSDWTPAPPPEPKPPRPIWGQAAGANAGEGHDTGSEPTATDNESGSRPAQPSAQDMPTAQVQAVGSTVPPQPQPSAPAAQQPSSPIPPVPPGHMSSDSQPMPLAPPAFGQRPLSPPVALPYPSGAYPQEPGQPAPEAKGRGRRKVVGVIAALALLAGGGTAGYLVAQTGDDSDPGPEQSAIIDEPINEPGPGANEPIEIPDEPGPVADDVEEPVAAVAAAVSPSVVRIDTATGTGSGIVSDADGHIITNAHVVLGATEVSVQMADGTRVEGVVVGSDPAVDVAVVRLSAEAVADLDLIPASFAPSSSVEVGQMAVAIGSPFGLEQSVTAGIISAVSRAVPNSNVEDGSPTVVEMVQTDAPINPGNSGGALADRQGRVVGMNTSIRTDGTTQGNLGVGFAIPSDTMLLIADRIVNGDSLESGFLGVSGSDPATGRAGALLTEIVPGGPAEAAGLEVGDLVVAIDGQEVAGMTELAAKIRLSPPESVISIEVLRGDTTVDLSVTLGALGQS